MDVQHLWTDFFSLYFPPSISQVKARTSLVFPSPLHLEQAHGQMHHSHVRPGFVLCVSWWVGWDSAEGHWAYGGLGCTCPARLLCGSGITLTHLLVVYFTYRSWRCCFWVWFSGFSGNPMNCLIAFNNPTLNSQSVFTLMWYINTTHSSSHKRWPSGLNHFYGSYWDLFWYMLTGSLSIPVFKLYLAHGVRFPSFPAVISE